MAPEQGDAMKLSYSAVWQDTVDLIRTHATLAAALAGVFLFLPALLVGYVIPQPQVKDLHEFGRIMTEYLMGNWHWLLLASLFNMIGTIAILLLFFTRGVTVGGAIVAAIMLVPFYFVASLLCGIAIGIGFVLLLVPGLYLFGRLGIVGPVVVAENQRNPVTAISRTWALTAGNGWAVLGMVLLVAIGAFVAMAVVNLILGLLFFAVAPDKIAALLTLIVQSATEAAVTVIMVALYAALYRALSGGGAAAAASA